MYNIFDNDEIWSYTLFAPSPSSTLFEKINCLIKTINYRISSIFYAKSPDSFDTPIDFGVFANLDLASLLYYACV